MGLTTWVDTASCAMLEFENCDGYAIGFNGDLWGIVAPMAGDDVGISGCANDGAIGILGWCGYDPTAGAEGGGIIVIAFFGGGAL